MSCRMLKGLTLDSTNMTLVLPVCAVQWGDEL